MDHKKHLALTIQAAAITFALADDLPVAPDAYDRRAAALDALATAITALRSLSEKGV